MGEWIYNKDIELNRTTKVIIYGAGSVGSNFYKYAKDNFELVVWVDQNYFDIKKDVEVSNPNVISELKTYDYVIITVIDETVQKKIKSFLESMGVDSEKIVCIKGYHHSGNGKYDSLYNLSELSEWKENHIDISKERLLFPYVTTSMVCTQEFLDFPFAKYWSNKLTGENPKYYRKVWEYVFICQALYERGYLKNGYKGLGFGVGREALPALFSSYGCDIVATDLDEHEAMKKGWIQSGEHAQGKKELLRKIYELDQEKVEENIIYRTVDMNEIPGDLRNFDFCWSSCSLEHLGSIRQGMEFVKNSIKVLKKGGIAVHTTEYNLYSNEDTLETEGLSIFRKKDLLQLKSELEEEGYYVEPFDWNYGSTIQDNFVDLPPFGMKNSHLRLMLDKYPCTSVGIIIKK